MALDDDVVVVNGLNFEQRHGKERVRVARVWRNQDGRQFFVEWNVGISLLSDCAAAYVSDDNSDIVATDTMKNTVYAKAKECSDQLSVEDFAILLAKHFTLSYKQVTTTIVKIAEKSWERVSVNGQPHNHGFKLGSEKHTTEVIFKKSGVLQVSSGIEGLSVLKTTQSGFERFHRDRYTALPETRERILATEMSASWRYSFDSLYSIPKRQCFFTETYLDVKKLLVDTFFGPPKEGVYSPSVQYTLYEMAKNVLSRVHVISSVRLKMPNLHFLPANISTKDNRTIVKFEHDVYVPTDEPHGSIEACLSRLSSKL
ncbi:uricase-2 isozyme 2-like [Cucurbita pepo subsp. pepo]|uniref:uricase-2 isozyme 2-like n=1 Tax=Cucurbita pepo subsp. pepo TaxID=3664 RepID=UPI000C9D74FA|nr:uricase-2 isozyme 2-like [Cucurbita pepo subsp. pepo]